MSRVFIESGQIDFNSYLPVNTRVQSTKYEWCSCSGIIWYCNFFLSLHLQGKTDLFMEFQTYTLYILCSFEIKNF